MKILRIVPMFRRSREVEAYIPHLIGFNEQEELELLRRVSRAIPRKLWAFVDNSIPYDYSGVLVLQNSGKSRFLTLREARKDIIGYNFKVKIGVKEQLEQCSSVAIDCLYNQFEQIRSLMSVYCGGNVRSIVLSVNSLSQFDKYRAEGFDYFIGDFYTKTVITGTRPATQINPVRANQLALLAEIGTWREESEDEADLRKVSQIIERDVALTISILKLSNSAAYGGQARVSNVHEAIVRVGTTNLKRWAVTYLVSAVTDEKTPEIARAALIRAKFMENIASHIQQDKWLAFFAGLASVTGVMLGISQKQALAELNAPPQVAEALSYQGPLGSVFGIAESYINGNMEQLEQCLAGSAKNIADSLYLSYLNAEMWVFDTLMSLN